MTLTASTRPRKRPSRWLLLLAIGLAYVGNTWHRVKRQRRIVDQIVAAGGRATYDYEFLTEAELDYALEPIQSAIWVTQVKGKASKEPKSRYRRDSALQASERQFETPPGPWAIRRLLGHDAFSYVETASFAWADEPRTLDPRVFLALPRLKVLVLRGKQVNDEWLDVAAQVPELRVLTLYGDSHGTVTKDGLAQLGNAKKLEALGLAGDWLRDESAAGLADLKQLRSLSIFRASNVSSALFANLDSMTGLRQLTILDAMQIDDWKAEHLKQLQDLHVLWLDGTSISSASLPHVSELRRLEWLSLRGTNIDDSGVRRLTTLTKLKRLNLNYTAVSDACLESISQLGELRHLELAGTKITDAGLAEIATITQLESLKLWPSEITDERLADLAQLQNLKELLIGPHVSKEAADALRQQLPKCKIDRINAKGHSSFPDSCSRP